MNGRAWWHVCTQNCQTTRLRYDHIYIALKRRPLSHDWPAKETVFSTWPNHSPCVDFSCRFTVGCTTRTSTTVLHRNGVILHTSYCRQCKQICRKDTKQMNVYWKNVPQQFHNIYWFKLFYVSKPTPYCVDIFCTNSTTLLTRNAHLSIS